MKTETRPLSGFWQKRLEGLLEKQTLSMEEAYAQGQRCGCRGSNDLCGCQGEPDAVTVKDRAALQARSGQQ